MIGKSIPIDVVKDFYCSHAYWLVPDNTEKWAIMLENSSAVVSVWDQYKLVGMMRALSDGVRWATILDVLVHPNYQNQGLGTRMMNTLLAQDELKVRTIFIGTPSAERFYTRSGFTPAMDGGVWMVKLQDHYARDLIRPVDPVQKAK